MPLVDELTISVELALPLLANERLVGLSEAVNPEGETGVERETVPVNP